MASRILNTGGSGFLGWNLCQLAKDRYEIWSTYDQHEILIPGVEMIQCDLTNPAAVRSLFNSGKFSGVIHVAAAAKPDYCQTHTRRSWRINVETPGTIAGIAAETRIPMVFTSTDLVFNGRQGSYDEAAGPDPISVYGEQKLEAEQMVLARCPKAAVCRMPTMFGFGTPVSGSFLTPLLQGLREGKPANLFVDEYRSFASGPAAAAGLLLALEQRWSGIWHLGGPERLSRFEFGKLVCEVFGLSPELLVPGRQAMVNSIAPRARDVSLNSAKATTAGYRHGAVREELLKLKNQ